MDTRACYKEVHWEWMLKLEAQVAKGGEQNCLGWQGHIRCQVLPMLKPAVVTCKGGQRGCGLITNHLGIEPGWLVVKGHVLDCLELGGLAPNMQFCPPIRGWILQIHPSSIHLFKPLLF